MRLSTKVFCGVGEYKSKIAADGNVKPMGSTKPSLLPVAAVNAWRKRSRGVDGADKEFQNL